MAAVGASGGVIGHQIDRRIGQPQFTRQHGFGHRRHADQIGPVTLKAINLRRRFQARPLGHGIDGGVTDRHSGPCRCLNQLLAQSGIVGVGEVDMPDGNAAAFVIRRFTPPGVVDELVRNDDVARLEIGADAADRSHRNHPGCTDLVQHPEVGAVIHLMRGNGMAVTMPRQKSHRLTTKLPEGHRPGRVAVRGTHHLTMRHLQIGQLGQATTTNDCQHFHSPVEAL